MFTLLSFTPFQPTPGLAFWSLVIFLIFLYLMKMGFKILDETVSRLSCYLELLYYLICFIFLLFLLDILNFK